MSDLSLQCLVESLSDRRLLNSERNKEFNEQILALCEEPRIIAAELIYRGWLTPFQLEMIVQNKARKLFLGSYTLLEPLGSGSMGKVYLARNWKTQQTVALKLIRDELASNELAVRRFQREIRALSKVNHPNIVSVYDADAVSDVIYYAMELVEGIDLGRVLQKSGPLNVARACEFAQQVALALESLYQAGLVHRDIKPSNLLLAKREQHIKLLDLGLARFQPDHQQYSGNLTRLGILIGTPDYISPEQIQDPRSATIRSDLYSLGCTLYHLLAGRAPFESVPVVDKLYHQCFSQPKPIEQLRGDLPKPLVKLIHRLLEKKPRRRYRRPAHVAWALEDVMRLLAPFDSNTNIVLESKLVRKFEKFEENLMPATECFKEIPTPKLLKKFSDTDSHHSLQLGV